VVSLGQTVSAPLLAVLEEQIKCAEAMLGALDDESRALTAGDPEGLNAASAGKARLVEQLESLEEERRGLTEALRLELSGPDAVGTKWKELLGLIERCKRQNLTNGSLVQARREQVSMALRLLRGTDLELYDASGMERASRNAQRLGSA
jgi:flagellar biosynthesis/type III secretory pathway chaperone